MFDKGSNQSYITNELRQTLKLSSKRYRDIAVLTFGNSVEQKRRCAEISIEVETNRGMMSIPALCVPTIMDDLSQTCYAQGHRNLSDLDLKNANVTGRIDLLIGCDVYWDLMTGEIRNAFQGLVAMNSVFGWIVSGRQSSNESFQVIRTYSNLLIEGDLSNWFIQNNDDDKFDSEDTQLTFTKSIKYENGRYVVHLP